MYRELTGIWAYASGTNGTVQVPAGSTVLQIVAWATTGSPTVTINGGASIPVPNSANGYPLTLRFLHDLVQAVGGSTGAQIVFSGTAGYFVEYV